MDADTLHTASSNGQFLSSSDDASWISNTTWLFIGWNDGFTDTDSGGGQGGRADLHFEIAAGLQAGISDVLGWTQLVPTYLDPFETSAFAATTGSASPGSRRLLPARRLSGAGASDLLLRGAIVQGVDLQHGDCVYPRVRAINPAGLRSAVASGSGACVDLVPPQRPAGLLFEAILANPEDISIASVNLRLTWTDAQDGQGVGQSGLESIRVAFGRQPNDDSVLAWTTLTPSSRSRETGARQDIAVGGYVATIVLRDVAGNEVSFHETSAVDLTAPASSLASVLDGIHQGEDVDLCRSPGLLTATFEGFSEPQSNIVEYVGCVGEWSVASTGSTSAPTSGQSCSFTNGYTLSVPGSSRIMELDVAGLGLAMLEGHGYYFGVKAINDNGDESGVAWSDGCVWTVDQPSLVKQEYDAMLQAASDAEERSGLGL